MTFSLDIVPRELRCPECGHYIKDVDLSDGFEMLVAELLQAKNADYWNEGYDVYDSALFPGLTFQVKYAQARCKDPESKTIDGRLCEFKEHWTWTWNERIAGSADFYILFGIRDDQVYTFLLPCYLWLDAASDDGRGGKIRITTCDEYSKCGRYEKAYKRNRFWRYVCRRWPDDLLSRIAHYTKRKQREQLSLFEERVPYLVRMN